MKTKFDLIKKIDQQNDHFISKNNGKNKINWLI